MLVALFTVEVNHMVGRVGDPDLRFPGDGGVKAGEGFAVGECRYKYQTRMGGLEKVGEFVLALLIHRAV